MSIRRGAFPQLSAVRDSANVQPKPPESSPLAATLAANQRSVGADRVSWCRRAATRVSGQLLVPAGGQLKVATLRGC